MTSLVRDALRSSCKGIRRDINKEWEGEEIDDSNEDDKRNI